jgi:hypothetical protein
MEKQIFEQIKHNPRKEIIILIDLIKKNIVQKVTNKEELKTNCVILGLSPSSFNNYFFVWNSLKIFEPEKLGLIKIDEQFYNWAVGQSE